VNFPADNPIFNFLYWLVDTPGLGGLAVGGIVSACLVTFGCTLRWLARGARPDDPEVYAYPTPALHDHV
jgi:hypothetical protein